MVGAFDDGFWCVLTVRLRDVSWRVPSQTRADSGVLGSARHPGGSRGFGLGFRV